MATPFPGSSGIRLPTDQTIGIDASKLFDVIARMGGAIAKLHALFPAERILHSLFQALAAMLLLLKLIEGPEFITHSL